MSDENVELVKRLIPPVGTDSTQMFRDDALWAAVKAGAEPFVAPDFEGAFVVLGEGEEFKGWMACGRVGSTGSPRGGRGQGGT